MQKIRSDAFTSFSVLGLAIILGVGGLLIALAYSLELLAECASRRARRGAYRRLEWSANGTLQLQRLAHEELGYGGAWAGADAFVPVTRPAGAPLAVLDIRDGKHPKLLPPPPMPLPSPPSRVDAASASSGSQAKEGV
jgi:hypothetical protein